MAADLPEDFEDNPDWSTVALSPLDYAAMLKVARARLGLSQEAAARMLGLPVATLRNWEQRRTMPDDAAKTLIALLYADPEDIKARLTPAA
ncbi:helix-turn-helix domain-containing protein [Pelagibacterium sediminicola]|uniref:helix-turn-helix domain-containing protein n=1 Tax=Pelagibacterium sediminicola TaxID=2248761 RepID=UPI0013006D22|nr:helix-turn-helix domain-containing protein [Pelagibacterium sediminicola]